MLRRSLVRRSFCAAVAVSALMFSCSASASLGDDVNSVQSDATHLKASVRVTQSANYSVHEMQAAGGTAVREYISPTGKVFAVAWQGAARPDLQQLLGSYYSRVAQAVQAEKMKRVGRHPISIQEPDLVVGTGGHPRAFTGRAYVPSIMPAAVRTEEIR